MPFKTKGSRFLAQTYQWDRFVSVTIDTPSYNLTEILLTIFHARARGSVPGLGGLKETKNVSSPSTCESQYCGELP